MIWDECSYDSFQHNLSGIYLLMKNQQNADGVNTGSSVPGPVAVALHAEMPKTKYAARLVGFGGELTRTGDKTVYESGIYTDPDLFRMMSFTPLQGNPATTLAMFIDLMSNSRQLRFNPDMILKVRSSDKLKTQYWLRIGYYLGPGKKKIYAKKNTNSSTGHRILFIAPPLTRTIFSPVFILKSIAVPGTQVMYKNTSTS